MEVEGLGRPGVENSCCASDAWYFHPQRPPFAPPETPYPTLPLCSGRAGSRPSVLTDAYDARQSPRAKRARGRQGTPWASVGTDMHAPVP